MLTRFDLINTWLMMIKRLGLSLTFQDELDSRNMFNNLSIISNGFFMHQKEFNEFKFPLLQANQEVTAIF